MPPPRAPVRPARGQRGDAPRRGHGRPAPLSPAVRWRSGLALAELLELREDLERLRGSSPRSRGRRWPAGAAGFMVEQTELDPREPGARRQLWIRPPRSSESRSMSRRPRAPPINSGDARQHLDAVAAVGAALDDLVERQSSSHSRTARGCARRDESRARSAGGVGAGVRARTTSCMADDGPGASPSKVLVPRPTSSRITRARPVVEDVRDLDHLDHEGRAPRGGVPAPMRVKMVDDPDLRGGRRDIGADLASSTISAVCRM